MAKSPQARLQPPVQNVQRAHRTLCQAGTPLRLPRPGEWTIADDPDRPASIQLLDLASQVLEVRSAMSLE